MRMMRGSEDEEDQRLMMMRGSEDEDDERIRG